MTLVSNITVYLVTWAFLGIGEDQDKIGPKVNYNITTLCHLFALLVPNFIRRSGASADLHDRMPR